MQNIIDKHPSVKQARAIGLFGCIDLQKNSAGFLTLLRLLQMLRIGAGDFLCKVNEASPVMAQFKTNITQQGLFTMMRGHSIFANPPLIINEAQVPTISSRTNAHSIMVGF